MGSGFNCLHSGNCCERPYTQISLTFGDAARLSAILDISPSLLFERGYIGISPFLCSDTVFECGLGLKIPCRMRVNRRCFVYHSRPLNCRLFPYWLLAEVPAEKLCQFADESYECIRSARIDEATRKKYKEYTIKVGCVLEKEEEATDKAVCALFNKYRLPKRIDLSSCRGYAQLTERIGEAEKRSSVSSKKEADNLRIGFAEQLIAERGYNRIYPALAALIKEYSEKREFTGVDELEIFEREREEE